MKIGYVCTNFNNSDFTQWAVKSLLENSGHSVVIVVVDNNSEADDRQKLVSWAAKTSCVELLMNKTNVGYFRGLNIGIVHLRKWRPDVEWIVVGNNDLEFKNNFCDELVEREPYFLQFAVISPDVVTDDGEHQNPHVISGISRGREIFYDLYYLNYYIGRCIYWLASRVHSIIDRPDEQQWQTAQLIHQGHGSCYILGPRFFEQFTELWAPTFMMSEEYFLSKQLSDVGQQVFYDPSLKVLHHCHASLDKIPNHKKWEMAKDAHRVYREYVRGFW